MIATRLPPVAFRQLWNAPGLHWGTYRAPPEPLAGLRGPTSKGEGRGDRRESGREERDCPLPFTNSCIHPELLSCLLDKLHTNKLVVSSRGLVNSQT